MGRSCAPVSRGSGGVHHEGFASYAAALIASAERAANSLVQFPERGRVVPEYGETSVRELFVGRYRLIYRIAGNTVTVVAFVHGARDLAALIPDIEQS